MRRGTNVSRALSLPVGGVVAAAVAEMLIDRPTPQHTCRRTLCLSKQRAIRMQLENIGSNDQHNHAGNPHIKVTFLDKFYTEIHFLAVVFDTPAPKVVIPCRLLRADSETIFEIHLVPFRDKAVLSSAPRKPTCQHHALGVPTAVSRIFFS